MKDYTTLSSELAKLSPERQERIKARADQIYLEELTFKYLQEKLGLSEDELEQYFTESDLGKAKLESRECLDLHTLHEVVSALGGTLEITIKIPQKEPFVLIGE
ncbi:MAG: XRE family transcriptional regulator [Limnospira sp. PMC 1291.21]|uniref:Transcriptional regulator n=2 Tax=Limnospira TaxID=2596745 RepID=A0A9P1NZK8_9CYAN|nr:MULTISPECIES: XRE family transcriptional regulator [Limnospira]EKD07056.1 putative transcriptional regulator [Arthrospira platensis C1]MDC0837130.1 XRE family transcriptional regulator [Limnoraphis robusta]MDY7053591.1 XRE family transcriptional regulator [Limnospira fusiformis LS22]QJB26057.1 XRE family transcriptional regulator [Limnospira fusiformis SAG 85.79]RAQ39308.1 transcriptional regulator [Arthrospira sp. O9.13F]